MQTNNASPYILWQVIRKNSAFLKRQRGINKLFSKERFNPVAINSFRYNGMVNKKGVEVTPNKTGKTGVTVTLKTKKTKKAHSVVLTKNSRQTLKTVKGLMSGYHPALTKVAQKRASKILISQKPLKAKRQKSE